MLVWLGCFLLVFWCLGGGFCVIWLGFLLLLGVSGCCWCGVAGGGDLVWGLCFCLGGGLFVSGVFDCGWFGFLIMCCFCVGCVPLWGVFVVCLGCDFWLCFFSCLCVCVGCVVFVFFVWLVL